LIFDRNNEGDYNITNNTNLVANLFIRKQSSFTENKIYPFATINELRPEIIQKAREIKGNTEKLKKFYEQQERLKNSTMRSYKDLYAYNLKIAREIEIQRGLK
jgi:hypothetical protein